MGTRVKTIELQVNGRKQSFELSHAERILGMVNTGGWALPEDSNYTFDKENGLTVRTNKKTDTKPQKG